MDHYHYLLYYNTAQGVCLCCGSRWLVLVGSHLLPVLNRGLVERWRHIIITTVRTTICSLTTTVRMVQSSSLPSSSPPPGSVIISACVRGSGGGYAYRRDVGLCIHPRV